MQKYPFPANQTNFAEITGAILRIFAENSTRSLY